ncbi:MAG: ATP-binding protein [Candidatus Acidiferrum sp.]|jgi:signal transduction histidine kinase
MNQYFDRTLNALSGAWTGDALMGVSGEIDERLAVFNRERSRREQMIRQEERLKERAHLARELHDTLFQGFLGASMLLDLAVEQTPADSPSKASLNRVLGLMYRVIDEGRGVLQGLRSSADSSSRLEKTLCDFGREFAPSGTQFRAVVMGKPRTLEAAIEHQIYLIAREALSNAVRHSGAKSIEVEVEYLPKKLRVVVRDDGRGFDAEMLESKRDLHWGLLGMEERATDIGAQLKIWSRPGAGTEVEISMTGDAAAEDRGDEVH